MNYIANMTRPKGDPKLLSTGPSSMTASDRLARNLGWFSIGLGLVEIFAARRVSRALGVEGSEKLIQAFGVREIGAGVMSLSTEKHVGLMSRIAGDALDIAALSAAMRPDNPKRGNAALALAFVLGVTALDVVGAQAVNAGKSRKSSGHRSYSDRSGFPNRQRLPAPASTVDAGAV